MIAVTRRQLVAAGGAMAAAPLLWGGCASHERRGPLVLPLPSGRPDGVRTGGARKIRINGGHEVWVRQVGVGDIPVLTLHGGPGFPHDYLECFSDFLPIDRIRYWYYDQLGCGFSDRPDDPSLWTLDRFRDEVEQVRAALGLDRFVLYGQSWGGMLAIEYTLAYPQHVSALIVSNMTASMASYVKHVTELRNALPAAISSQMGSFEDRGAYDAPEYQRLLFENLYARYLCRLDPWPEPVMRSYVNLNPQVYNTMQGPSEFAVTGNLKRWDRWSDLHRIGVPTLLLVGRHDTMAVEDIQRMGRLIPNARVAVCEKGSHLSLYDDQVAYFDALVPFLLNAPPSPA